VCSYDFVTEFNGKAQGNIDMLTDPDIVPYPPADYAGTSVSPIARYKRFCSGGQWLSAGAAVAASAAVTLSLL
tara:strand:+ start:276 stop:494 length:219 start_codon:yes stop_codon:yes gene_type:complete